MRAAGEYTTAKLEFLQRAMRYWGCAVNRKHCPPLHPHGARMIKDGLVTLRRDGAAKTRTSRLIITPAGVAELRRLEKRLGVKRTEPSPPPSPIVLLEAEA